MITSVNFFDAWTTDCSGESSTLTKGVELKIDKGKATDPTTTHLLQLTKLSRLKDDELLTMKAAGVQAFLRSVSC